LAEFEYIRTIFEVIINGYSSNILAEKLDSNVKVLLNIDLLRLSVKNLIEFDLNNMYQKYFEQLIILITNKHSPKIIINHVFNDLDLISILIDNCENNLKFKFKK
jgi:hypothetical protein